MQKDRSSHGLIYLSQGKVVGLCLGTTSLKLTQQNLRKIRFKVIRRLIRPDTFFSNFGNIVDQLAISIKSRRISVKSNYILLWFIAPEDQGKGSGKVLLADVIRFLTKQNNFPTYVDVRRTSTSALDGYKKQGFILVGGTKLSHILVVKQNKS
jgi:hypothetical protein